jgi:hypothetical protein
VIVTVGTGLITTLVVQVERFPQASFTVQVIVEVPTLKFPLALLPVPLLLVAPDI